MQLKISKSKSNKFDDKLETPYFRHSLVFSTGILPSLQEIEIDNYLKSKNVVFVKDSEVPRELEDYVYTKNSHKRSYSSRDTDIKESRSSFVLNINTNDLFKKRSTIVKKNVN